jgi:hypothetical protein
MKIVLILVLVALIGYLISAIKNAPVMPDDYDDLRKF